MVIKKGKSSEVIFDISENNVGIELRSLDDRIVITVKIKEGLTDRVIELVTPGDYEYSKVSITALESTESPEHYSGLINFVRLSIGNLNFVYLPRAINLKDESIDTFAQNLILIFDENAEESWVKEVIKFFDPPVLVMLSNIYENKDFLSMFVSKETISSIKIKLSDSFSEQTKKIFFIQK